jgi:hypothetical protein
MIKLFNKGDYQAINNHIVNTNWEEVMQKGNTQECWDLLLNIINNLTDSYVPMARITTDPTGKKASRRNQISDHLKQLIIEKKVAFKRWKKTSNIDDYSKYAKIRNKVKNESTKETKLLERNIARESKTNPKLLWSYYNSKNKVKDTIPELIKVDGTMTSSSKEKADLLNNYFFSVFNNSDADSTNVPQVQIEFPMPTLHITEDDVKKEIRKLKEHKASGPDEIRAKFLKETVDSLAKPLAIIFRKSLDEGYLPLHWRTANVTPIFKKGNRHDKSNYRPISLTSIICKTLESIIKQHMIKHLIQNNLITKHQHGFLPGRSCETQLLEVMDDWTSELDQGNTICSVYMDFMKAFDKVSHQLMIKKIEAYGNNDQITRWIQAFLTDRRQRVLHNDAASDWLPVRSGIPQGSCLGPILFLIFINDLPAHVKSTTKLFADDTKIYRTINTGDDASELQSDLDKAVNWSTANTLMFHPDKCVKMTIGTAQPIPIGMTIGNNQTMLREERVVKDLGVKIDNHLSFEDHIAAKCATANQRMGIIRRTFKHLDNYTFRLLFIGHVRPHLEYCVSVWNPHLKHLVDQIENVQRRATKLLPKMKNLSYNERLSALKLPSLYHRRIRGDLINTFKYCNGLINSNSPSFRVVDHAYTTRSSNKKLFKPRFKTSVRQHFFSCRVINRWNELPEHVTNVSSVNAFKNAVDTFYGESQYVYPFSN